MTLGEWDRYWADERWARLVHAYGLSAARRIWGEP